MSEPTTAVCPCGGTCHHSTGPCSMGCWAAQKPWKPEEAVATLRADLAAKVRGLDAYQEDDQELGYIYDNRAVYREAVLDLIEKEPR